MAVEDIKDLENLLNLDASKKIISQKVVPLTAPGENYGSVMLAVDITIDTPDGPERLSVVAKTVPTNEIIQKVFKTSITFKNEISFYKEIFPTLRNFQIEMGVAEDNLIDFAAKFLGGRISLDPKSSEVDSDGVLLLENLKLENYIIMDRFQGLDLNAAKLVLRNLAHLHSVPIAMKIKKPVEFEAIKNILLSNQLYEKDAKTADLMMEKILSIVKEAPRCHPYYERVSYVISQKFFVESRELFSTISHNDIWVNNTMFKVVNGKAIANKLIDFQMFNYASLARDLLFFLFSSVNSEILREYYDDLIKFYYDTFISMLLELKCDVDQFNYDVFLEELSHEAKTTQFFHCLFMVTPIFLPKSEAKDVSELKLTDLFDVKATELHKEKFAFIVEEFAKRNWI